MFKQNEERPIFVKMFLKVSLGWGEEFATMMQESGYMVCAAYYRLCHKYQKVGVVCWWWDFSFIQVHRECSMCLVKIVMVC